MPKSVRRTGALAQLIELNKALVSAQDRLDNLELFTGVEKASSDALLFFDRSAEGVEWLSVGENLALTGTTLAVSSTPAFDQLTISNPDSHSDIRLITSKTTAQTWTIRGNDTSGRLAIIDTTGATSPLKIEQNTASDLLHLGNTASDVVTVGGQLDVDNGSSQVKINLINTAQTWTIQNNALSDRLAFAEGGSEIVQISAAAVSTLLQIGVSATDTVDVGGDLEVDGSYIDAGGIFTFDAGAQVGEIKLVNTAQTWSLFNSFSSDRLNFEADGTSIVQFSGGANSNLFQVGVIATNRVDVNGVLDVSGDVQLGSYLIVWSRTDANRGSASTAGAGAVIFNTDDGQLNISDGTNWTLPDGTTT